MNREERRDSMSRESRPRTISSNRSKRRDLDKKKRKEETRSKPRSGRKKLLSMSKLRKRRLSISETSTRNTPQFSSLCSRAPTTRH